jgi:hypothetical protein
MIAAVPKSTFPRLDRRLPTQPPLTFAGVRF